MSDLPTEESANMISTEKSSWDAPNESSMKKKKDNNNTLNYLLNTLKYIQPFCNHYFPWGSQQPWVVSCINSTLLLASTLDF